MAGFLLFFLAACMFMQILTEGAVFEKEIFTYYEVSAEYKTGGGLVGGILCRLCVQAFGTVGTYVIAGVSIMISLVLITQKSMFDMIRKCSRWMYRNAAQHRQRRLEEARIRQEEEEEQEQQEQRRQKRHKRTLEDSEDTVKKERKKIFQEQILLKKKRRDAGTGKRAGKGNNHRRTLYTGKSISYSQSRSSGSGSGRNCSY